MKKIAFCLLRFLKSSSFLGGGSVSHPQSTCRCARMPRSASSRLLQFVSPIPSGRKTRPRPTYPKWKSNDVSISSMEFSWRCTPKNLMKKKVEDVKKNNMFHWFFGFFGEHLNKIASLWDASSPSESWRRDEWNVDNRYDLQFLFCKKMLIFKKKEH